MNAATPQADVDAYRPALVRHAYRMLGERAEAEDAVQDAYLRWHAARERTAVADDRAFLRATVTRLCIDRARSARARREVYVGPWLPEPIVERGEGDPETLALLADDVSFALLLALERLTALERAAFLLHDVMDVPFAEIARTLGRSEDAVKNLASRARTHVRAAHTRRTPKTSEALRVRDAFAAAIRRGELAELQRLLTDDVVFTSDGGGKAVAALVPVRGRDRVARMLLGLAAKSPASYRVSLALVNGAPGFVIADGERTIQTLALDVIDGRISAFYVTRNPDKLGAITLPRA